MLQRSCGNLGSHLGSVSLRYTGTLSRRVLTDVDSWSRLPYQRDDAPKNQISPHPDHLSHLEAVLFLTAQPLPSRKLAQLVHLADGTAARTMVKELNSAYEDAGRAFRVEEVAGGYQLRTQKIFAPWIRRMVSIPPEIRMSGPTMETLAVVAYRQPVMRTDIEKVRGVQCGEILRQLMERGMVRISGRANELGRPFLYGTTRKFLELFGLRSLDELPRASMLRANENSLMVSSPLEDGEQSVYPFATEEDSEVRVCDATDQSEQRDLAHASEKELPVVANQETEDEYEDDEYEDDEDEEDDDGFSDEEWEEVEDEDDVDEQDEDDEDEDWDDDEDWDEDEDEDKDEDESVD